VKEDPQRQASLYSNHWLGFGGYAGKDLQRIYPERFLGAVSN